MKKIKILLSLCLIFTLLVSCIKKKETNDVAKAANATQTSSQLNENQKKRQAWLEKRKATSATQTSSQLNENQKKRQAWLEKKKAATKGKAQSVNRTAASTTAKFSASELKSIKKEMKRPVALKKDKGNFLQELSAYLKITVEKTNKANELIKKYQRKGMDFKFFGGFYENNSKPFAKELAKILTPLEMENFKHFHSYWFDRIPYPKPDMPASLFYRLNLSKEQFAGVSTIYSQGTLDMKKVAATDQAGMLKVRTDYETKIASLLDKNQKTIYDKILHIAF